MLDVGSGHKLNVVDWGNQKAKTTFIFLHGGPGSPISDKYKQRFDPKLQRVIFFDQRGTGKSTPKGSLKNNTTQDLVEDIEKIATKLHLDAFVLTGGSWGSCLALAYALQYPSRLEGLVISGVFTARSGEIEYLDNGGFKTFYPDLWDRYVLSVPAKFRDNPSAYYYDKIFGDNAELAKKAAYAYSEMLEGPLLGLDDRYTPNTYEKFDPDPMRIELHYLKNNCFMPEGHIMNNAHKIKVPVWIVQGRYDMVCPPETAYELHRALPNSQLIWTTAGHGNDRPNYDVNRTIYLQLST